MSEAGAVIRTLLRTRYCELVKEDACLFFLISRWNSSMAGVTKELISVFRKTGIFYVLICFYLIF